jgi:hypothetical protein
MDSTTVKLYYNSNPTPREVRIDPILFHASPVLVNGPLSIPANTIKTFTEQFTIPSIFKVSVLSVAPHMHLIGETIKVWGNKINGDTIRLIDIPHWDFHWQGAYYFQKPVVIEGGTTLKAAATYNNTSSNSHNPNNPPKAVSLGEATTDEMMLVYFAYTGYQSGDENLLIDSTLLTTSVYNPNIVVKKMNVFPNPANAYFQFENPEQHKKSMLTIWSMDGRKVFEEEMTHKNLVNIPVQALQSGVYNVYLKTSQTFYADKIVIQH